MIDKDNNPRVKSLAVELGTRPTKLKHKIWIDITNLYFALYL